jgi:glutathione S-transferase
VRERLGERLAYVSDALANREYLLGSSFSVADAYLFTILRWCIGKQIPLTPTVQAYFERVGARPGVRRAMVAEGLARA